MHRIASSTEGPSQHSTHRRFLSLMAAPGSLQSVERVKAQARPSPNSQIHQDPRTQKHLGLPGISSTGEQLEVSIGEWVCSSHCLSVGTGQASASLQQGALFVAALLISLLGQQCVHLLSWWQLLRFPFSFCLRLQAPVPRPGCRPSSRPHMYQLRMTRASMTQCWGCLPSGLPLPEPTYQCERKTGGKTSGRVHGSTHWG